MDILKKEKKLTVLYVCDNWPVCGAAFSVLGILKEMTIRGVKVVIAVNGEDFFYQRVKELDYTVYHIPFSKMAVPDSTSNATLAFRKIPRYLKKIKSDTGFKKLLKIENIDIVHYCTITVDGGFDVFENRGIPIIWHIREFLNEDLKWHFRSKRQSIRELESSKMIIAVSERVKEKYEKDIKNIEIKTIYNGIDVSPFMDLKKTTSSEIRIGIVGTIKKEKGQYELIEAFSKIARKFLNIKLIIIGKFDPLNNSYHSQLRDYAEKNELQQKVEFRGQKTSVQEIWSDIDIAVVPSWAEAFGRVTVEAILAKCFVVGADTGGTKEILDYLQTGAQFEAKNIEDLANKLEFAIKVIMNKEFNYDIPRENALKEFSISNNASNILSVYKKIGGS